MAARGLQSFEHYLTTSIGATEAALATLVGQWTLNKNLLVPRTEGLLGVSVVGNLTGVTTGVVFFAVVLGGTVSVIGSGQISAWHQVAANGQFASPRLTIDVSSLFATEMEYAKVFAYCTGQGGAPTVRSLALMLSGDAVAAAAASSGGLPPTDTRAWDQFGVDIDLATDLPPSFALASGLKNLANAVVRRLSTPRGALAAIGDDPNYGFDLMGQLLASMTQSQIQALGGEIEAEVIKDERIASAEVALTHDHATSVLTVDLAMTTAAGPFRLILAVSQVTIEILNASIERAA